MNWIKEYCWVVDPIDGTLNFSRKVPIFGISVALFNKNKPTFGVIYFPRLDEYYFAIKDKGAFLGDKRIFIRKNSSTNGLFGACTTGFNPNEYKEFINLRFKLNFQSTHSYCSVYNFAYTAAGHYDFVFSVRLALWDIAAGWILIEEAGGEIEVFHVDEKRKKKGDPYHLWCIGGNKKSVDYLLPQFKRLAE